MPDTTISNASPAMVDAGEIAIKLNTVIYICPLRIVSEDYFSEPTLVDFNGTCFVVCDQIPPENLVPRLRFELIYRQLPEAELTRPHWRYSRALQGECAQLHATDPVADPHHHRNYLRWRYEGLLRYANYLMQHPDRVQRLLEIKHALGLLDQMGVQYFPPCP